MWISVTVSKQEVRSNKLCFFLNYFILCAEQRDLLHVDCGVLTVIMQVDVRACE